MPPLYTLWMETFWLPSVENFSLGNYSEIYRSTCPSVFLCISIDLLTKPSRQHLQTSSAFFLSLWICMSDLLSHQTSISLWRSDERRHAAVDSHMRIGAAIQISLYTPLYLRQTRSSSWREKDRLREKISSTCLCQQHPFEKSSILGGGYLCLCFTRSYRRIQPSREASFQTLEALGMV